MFRITLSFQEDIELSLLLPRDRFGIFAKRKDTKMGSWIELAKKHGEQFADQMFFSTTSFTDPLDSGLLNNYLLIEQRKIGGYLIST